MTDRAVAVFNSNSDIVDLLRIALEGAGFVVISAEVDDIKRGGVDLEKLVRQHQPAVVVYDIAPPYDRQWGTLSHVRQLDALSAVPFVLTSTNPARVRELAGIDENIYEIVGKPYDLADIVEAVKRALPQGGG